MSSEVDKASDQISERRYRGQTSQERRDERRGRLIEAAVEAFGSLGYQAVSIEELCRRANLSTRNFYELFADREALLASLYDDLNQQAQAEIVEAIAGTDPDDMEAA